MCYLSKQADPLMILNDDNAMVVLSNRLQEGGVPSLEQGMVVGQLTLADALIVGNCNNQVGVQYSKTPNKLHNMSNSSSAFLCKWSDTSYLWCRLYLKCFITVRFCVCNYWVSFGSQVKFSELTIDMFRMLQALEREPVNLATQSSKPGTLVREDSYTLPVTLYVECFWVFSPFLPRYFSASPFSVSLSLLFLAPPALCVSQFLSHSFISLIIGAQWKASQEREPS